MFRKLSYKYFEPASMWFMILGLAFIVQPWSMVLHRYSVVIVLIGLVAFVFFSHIKYVPEEESADASAKIDVSRREVGQARPQSVVVVGPPQEEVGTEQRVQRDDTDGRPRVKEKVLSAAFKEVE